MGLLLQSVPSLSNWLETHRPQASALKRTSKLFIGTLGKAKEQSSSMSKKTYKRLKPLVEEIAMVLGLSSQGNAGQKQGLIWVLDSHQS
ncbi:hypothetical protein E1B28_007903 [Marasmius oreades]|uniref:Uncharacterized protein n=1 Tax=Marasmius oreades TaxID=181124 RepID=A0A9P7S2U8_9AGAR|nr:uncharacterized protein E1B28_007903 [Marasmius oreades]KAG7094302.1 hypothetical protein E1B28_007903 [Marasmius oreades]